MTALLTKEEAIKSIEATDALISDLRESWQDAEPEKKAKYMDRINMQLDRRIVFMKARDGHNL